MISSLLVLGAILSVIIVPGLLLQRAEDQAEAERG